MSDAGMKECDEAFLEWFKTLYFPSDGNYKGMWDYKFLGKAFEAGWTQAKKKGRK